jgi:hypothetical protein
LSETWIDQFLYEVREAETPINYLYWGAIATISAIAAPLVSLNKGGLYNLRPNLYILLMGPSGLGKAFSITTAKKLVSMIGGTRVISGRATIEGIVRDLSLVRSTPEGIGFKDARGFIAAGEFSASIHKNTQALDILTDLYDAHDNPKWKNTLKSSPIETLNKPCITLFSGANDDMFHSAIPEEHIRGGFVGRLLLPSANKKSKYNSLTKVTHQVDFDGLAQHLMEMSKISGEFKYAPEASDYFDIWYSQFNEQATELQDKTGFVNRMHDHILKVAMCISLSRKLDLVLEYDDIQEAVIRVQDLLKENKNVSMANGKSETAPPTKVFLREMTKAKGYSLSRRDLLARTMGELDSIELNKVVETLTQAGMVYTNSGGEVVYTLTPTFIGLWEKKVGKEKES